ncbi:hypothetical protein Golob_001013 [Gossypium lobatum]|uniref:Uncharacterized protein n=1 Tax=Gossypium lobatum TaxID=34289 RepID=A0A7J8NA14_9ROSI|nr:hypothetical protein [Gossypium lobatum]
MEEVVDIVVNFEDNFPSMMERYDVKWLLGELCNEFWLLMDKEKRSDNVGELEDEEHDVETE